MIQNHHMDRIKYIFGLQVSYEQLMRFCTQRMVLIGALDIVQGGAPVPYDLNRILILMDHAHIVPKHHIIIWSFKENIWPLLWELL